MQKSHNNKSQAIYLLAGFALTGISAGAVGAAQDEVESIGDILTVTASRVERYTQEIPTAIDVIDRDRIEGSTMFNIKDAIRGTPGVLIDSKNGGSDVRLIIRGAGQKANYGVCEIMVLRDGVPMTDPDSFSRFDYIDTQDIARIEITTGPGSLYSSGAAGGTVHIISKSVFDLDSNRVKLGYGEHGTGLVHGRYAGDFNDKNAFALTFSHREANNAWRKWNEYESNQFSFKHGFMLSDGGTLDSELSYSKADIQLPAYMNEEEYEEFEDTGKQRDTSSPGSIMVDIRRSGFSIPGWTKPMATSPSNRAFITTTGTTSTRSRAPSMTRQARIPSAPTWNSHMTTSCWGTTLW